MNIQPTHRFLASTMLSSACRFRHVAREQAHALTEELCHQLRDLESSVSHLRKVDRGTAIREIAGSIRHFLRDTFLRSPLQILHRHLGNRTVCFMFAGLLPLFAAGVLVTVPALLFNHPDQRAYFFFARILQTDAASLVPALLGLLSLIVALRFPLQPDDHQPGHHA